MIRNQLSKAQRDESGFTLIELLIVIVVLGVLAGIVVFGVGTFKKDSEDSALCANSKSVEVASQAYIARTGGPAATIAALVTAKYLKAEPVPPVTYVGATGEVTFPAGCNH